MDREKVRLKMQKSVEAIYEKNLREILGSENEKIISDSTRSAGEGFYKLLKEVREYIR